MKPIQCLLDLLYPPKCPFCGRVLEKGEEGLCGDCQQALPWTGPEECRDVEFCDLCLSPLWYRDKVRDAVHRYKFGGGSVHAHLLGELMAQCLCDRQKRPAELITWIPLHPKSLRKRGFDQAELLALRVSELTGLPAVPTLKKVRQTETQSYIVGDAARRANVFGAYAVMPEADVAGRRVVLVDDVVTSGATLSEGAALLRESGAREVTGLTIARAK